ncbi:hypothetical protein BX600DRAFT_473315 [Xylariales sp. PMI_506]|nr:hypothetical protein BX600DRAFT_473315 [Xylariales sp. PMI_506]
MSAYRNTAQPGNGYVTYGETPGSGPAPTTSGPHRHDLANKLDPRVDSSADKVPVSTGTNVHKSKLANILDPRVDSKLANQSAAVGGVGGARHGHAGVVGTGAAATHHGHHHGPARGSHPGAYGPTHGAGAAGYGRPHEGTHARMGGYEASPASGPASHTAGPHSSNLLNKLDPTVDSHTGASKQSGARTGGAGYDSYGANRY